MLIESDGLVTTLGQRTGDDGGYVAAPGSEVEGVGFVKDDNEQAVDLKLRAVNKGIDPGLEPRIGGAERAIVRVIAKIGDKADALTGRGGVLATCPTQPAWAKTQKASASNRNRAADRMCKRDAYICLDLGIEFFLDNSAGELLRKARTTLLRHLLILAYSLVSVCPVGDTRAGRKGRCS